MQNDNFKVHVVERPDLWDQVEVFILENRLGRTYLASVKDGILMFDELKEDTMPMCTIRVPKSVMQQIVEAFVKVMPPANQFEVDAELKATKYHLEDMRKLLKIDAK